jgi:hypothetical protein
LPQLEGFVPPLEGTPEHEAWVDGPRPDVGHGRGQWLAARSARSRALTAQQRREQEAKAKATADGFERSEAGSEVAQQVGDTATVRAVALAILNDPNALDTSRIAAGKLLVQADPDARSHGHSSKAETWQAITLALDRLPIEQRLRFLREAVHGEEAVPNAFERSGEGEEGNAREATGGGHPSAGDGEGRDSAGTSRPQDLHPAHP